MQALQDVGANGERKSAIANDLRNWLETVHGPGGWASTPLGGWRPSYPFLVGRQLDVLEGWHPYSWDPLERWMAWIEETKQHPYLPPDEQRMLLLNAVAVLEGQTGTTDGIERLVAAAERGMLQARAEGAVSDNPLIVDPPTPFSPMGDWLDFLDSMMRVSPSIMQEWSLADACKVVLTTRAARRAAEVDPEGKTRLSWS